MDQISSAVDQMVVSRVKPFVNPSLFKVTAERMHLTTITLLRVTVDFVLRLLSWDILGRNDRQDTLSHHLTQVRVGPTTTGYFLKDLRNVDSGSFPLLHQLLTTSCACAVGCNPLALYLFR